MSQQSSHQLLQVSKTDKYFSFVMLFVTCFWSCFFQKPFDSPFYQNRLAIKTRSYSISRFIPILRLSLLNIALPTKISCWLSSLEFNPYTNTKRKLKEEREEPSKTLNEWKELLIHPCATRIISYERLVIIYYTRKTKTKTKSTLRLLYIQIN